MADDGRALSYHDVVLRNSDIDLLRGPYWLNDQIIAFYFEYLHLEVHPDLSSALALLPGASSFLLLNSVPAEAAVIFEALQLHDKELVIFAVNDNPDVEMAAGGSHWSCLCYHRPSNSFRHYDSCAPHNHSIARSLAGAAAPLVCSRGSNAAGAAAMLPSFVEVAAMPQQQNSNDCGVYVLAIARTLCDSLAQAYAAAGGDGAGPPAAGGVTAEQESTLLQNITPSAVCDIRRQGTPQAESAQDSQRQQHCHAVAASRPTQPQQPNCLSQPATPSNHVAAAGLVPAFHRATATPYRQDVSPHPAQQQQSQSPCPLCVMQAVVPPVAPV